ERAGGPLLKAVEEFLVHGVKDAFPAQRGEATRGVPSATPRVHPERGSTWTLYSAICGRARTLGRWPRAFKGMPEIPLCLKGQPDLGVPTCQCFEQQRRVRTDTTTSPDDRVEALKRNVHPLGRLDLRHAQWLEGLLQEH